MELDEMQQVYADKITANISGLNGYSYVESMYEDDDNFKSYQAPAAFISIVNLGPMPEGAQIPFDHEIFWGVVVVVDEGTAEDSYKDGWRLARAVAALFAGSCYVGQGQTGSMKINNVSRQERLDRNGVPVGTYYWTVLMSQVGRYERA